MNSLLLMFISSAIGAFGASSASASPFAMVVASIVSRAHSAGWVSISAIFEVFCGVVPVPWAHKS